MSPDPYHRARREHALLLRCEGLTLRQIGARFGVSHETARRLVDNGACELQRALRHSRLRCTEQNKSLAFRFAIAKEIIRKEMLPIMPIGWYREHGLTGPLI